MSGLFDDFRNEFSKPNNTLVQIILVNTIIFLSLLLLNVISQWAGQPEVYGLVMKQLTITSSLPEFIRRPWTMLTYAFTHEDIFHILYNMLFLYWFGRLIDEYLGARRLMGLYVLGAVVGGVVFLIIYNVIPYYQGRLGTPMLGASGAAFAVAVGAATLLPNYTFHLLFFGPVRIKYIVFFFIVLSFAQTLGDNAGGHIAHLGGALLGFVFVKLLQSGTDLGQPVYWVMEGWQRLVRPRPAVKVSYRQRSSTTATANTFVGGTGPVVASTTPDQDEIDTLLDKISRSGYESLTRDEKQKLFRASQKN